jgi:hypothetical protein
MAYLGTRKNSVNGSDAPLEKICSGFFLDAMTLAHLLSKGTLSLSVLAFETTNLAA